MVQDNNHSTIRGVRKKILEVKMERKYRIIEHQFSWFVGILNIQF